MDNPTEQTPSVQDTFAPCEVCARVYLSALNRVRQAEAARDNGAAGELARARQVYDKAARCYRACGGTPGRCPVCAWFMCRQCSDRLAAAIVKRRAAKTAARAAVAAATVTPRQVEELHLAELDVEDARTGADNCARGLCVYAGGNIPW